MTGEQRGRRPGGSFSHGGGLVAESGTWSLQTAPTTEPCGYVIVVTATDNTIVDSGYIGLYTPAFVGFCLRAAKEG